MRVAALLIALAAPSVALAQFNPLGIISRAVTTAMDSRTTAEVAADAEISAGASKRLLDDPQAEWTGVSVLVFARHVVLAGAVKSAEVRKRVEEVVRRDRDIRSLKNELRVGGGSFARDTALEAEINATLTGTSGIASVNMRWSASGGHVVLMGVARSTEAAALAVSTTRAIKGVKSVKPHLRVVAPK